jgi:hypothetical protein
VHVHRANATTGKVPSVCRWNSASLLRLSRQAYLAGRCRPPSCVLRLEGYAAAARAVEAASARPRQGYGFYGVPGSLLHVCRCKGAPTARNQRMVVGGTSCRGETAINGGSGRASVCDKLDKLTEDCP